MTGRRAEDQQEPGTVDAAPGEDGAETDTDTGQAAAGAPAHDDERFGRPGRPVSPNSPFMFGLLAGAGALAAWFLGHLLWDLASVLVLIAVSMFLAVGLNPVVEWLMRRGLPRAWAVLVVILAVVAALAVFLVALVPVITDQATALARQAPGWIDELAHSKKVQEVDQEFDVLDKLKTYITGGDLAKNVFGGVLGVGLAILGFLANAFLVTVMTLYFLSSLPRIKQSIYRLAPASRRERVARLTDQILQGIGAYVSGAFVVALCAGITSLIMLFVVGLGEYAVALALVVALLDVIPMIGATIGAVIVCAIGFATDWQTGLILVAFYVVYQQVENYVIYPRVMSRAVEITGLLTVIAALVGASLLGVVGALMAIPTAAAIVLLVNEIFVRRQDAR